ncbi:hypothetical protein [Aerococcus viridans]|uniref:hypothetical protein n=1 Tax=Aerococcus TaxID=1375 RepID=UPI002DB751EB|nr:hypothetical protein [Aerococcus viridans]MEC1387551.1 hypothetical protein [Aerococcus viridans]
MEFIRTMIEIKWPFLLVELMFLIGGIALITSGIKVRKQSKSTAVINSVIGIIITLVSLYALFITFIFGYNS